MRLAYGTFLLVGLQISQACRPSDSQQADNKDVQFMDARRTALTADREWVVFYANETNLQGTVQVGGQIISEAKLYNSYLKALQVTKSTVADKWNKDLVAFPAAVKKQVSDLEDKICQGNTMPNAAGLIVFTNGDLNRQQYRFCVKGSRLAPQPFVSGVGQGVSFPAAKIATFNAAMEAVSRKIASETSRSVTRNQDGVEKSAVPAVALILKSHGNSDKAVVACHPSADRDDSAPGVALVALPPLSSSSSTRDDGIATDAGGEEKLSADGDKPMFAPSVIKDMNADGGNQSLATPAEIDAFTRSRGGSSPLAGERRIGLDCTSDGFTASEAQEAVSRVQRDLQISLVFFDSCKSGTSRTRQQIDGEVWGSDAEGLRYEAVDYSMLTGQAARKDSCGNLDFYCSLKGQLEVLSNKR
jgi:hypothetical protein